MIRLVTFGAVFLLAAPCALAQGGPAPIVENTGQATVYGVPSYAEFWLHFEASGETLEAAMAMAGAFGENLQKQLLQAELQPGESGIDAPGIPPGQTEDGDKVVLISAWLRFPFAPFSKPEVGLIQFARLCDKVYSLGRALDCRVSGPHLETADKESLARAAVTAATENAYSAAEAIAGVLRSAVFAVDSVQILDIEYNRPLDTQTYEPNFKQVSCTARVRVVYTLTVQP